MLPCATACCSALQCVAVRCSASQCDAVRCSALQCVAVRCSMLQCSAVCCSVCAVRCSVCSFSHAPPRLLIDGHKNTVRKNSHIQSERKHVRMRAKSKGLTVGVQQFAPPVTMLWELHANTQEEKNRETQNIVCVCKRRAASRHTALGTVYTHTHTHTKIMLCVCVCCRRRALCAARDNRTAYKPKKSEKEKKRNKKHGVC